MYQTFADQSGLSDSPEKLRALRLPSDMSGKSFLDLGCNEGFFCGEAVERGASRVVGYELDPTFFNRATARFPQVEFRLASWWEITDETFDFILFSSTLHYEKRPKKLLNFLGDHLNENGMLILECGVSEGDPWLTHAWRSTKRHDGNWPYPTFSLLRDVLLEQFAVRYIGRSVSPPLSDGPTRHVFHCKKAHPTVILLTGESGSGKTSLADRFGKQGIAVCHTDHLIELALTAVPECESLIGRYLQQNFSSRFSLQYLNCNLARARQFAQYVADFIVEDNPTTVVEGGVFVYEGIKSSVIQELESRGFRIWLIEPSKVLTDTSTDVVEPESHSPVDYDGRVENGYAGRIDGITDRTLIGWCCLLNSPDAVSVTLIIDDVAVGIYRAISVRQDLRARGFGIGRHGLYIDLSEHSYTEDSVIVVQTTDQKFTLSSSGSKVCALNVEWKES